MIRLVSEEGPAGCPIVMLGLSHGNLDQLRAGDPILLDIDQCAALGLGQRQLVIFTGEDEVKMTQEVEDHGLIPKGATEKLRRKFEEYETARAEGNAAEPPTQIH